MENNRLKLAAAVLLQAFRDAGKRNEEGQQARSRLLEDEESFPAWCRAANLNSGVT